MIRPVPDTTTGIDAALVATAVQTAAILVWKYYLESSKKHVAFGRVS